MLKAVGLGNRLNHKPNQMSGGQQQRVSIARAFVEKPEIIFADEPTGNLDTKTTEEVMELIAGMAEQYGQTILLVSHDTEASDYADRIVHIRDGEIERIEEKEKYKLSGKVCCKCVNSFWLLMVLMMVPTLLTGNVAFAADKDVIISDYSANGGDTIDRGGSFICL